MDVMFLLLALVALAGAAVLWGVDSRDQAWNGRPHRWFIELDGRARADADRHPRGGRLHRPTLSREPRGGLRAPRATPGGLDAAAGSRDEPLRDRLSGSDRHGIPPSLVHPQARG